MKSLRGTLRAAPLWGTGLLLGLLGLIGVVPSGTFMSELLTVKAAVNVRAIVVLVAFLVAAGTAFIGMFGHAMAMAWGQPTREGMAEKRGTSRRGRGDPAAGPAGAARPVDAAAPARNTRTGCSHCEAGALMAVTPDMTPGSAAGASMRTIRNAEAVALMRSP